MKYGCSLPGDLNLEARQRPASRQGKTSPTTKRKRDNEPTESTGNERWEVCKCDYTSILKWNGI